MAFEKYVKLAGSVRKPMPGAKKAGTLDPGEAMLVTVILRPRKSRAAQPLTALAARGEQLSRKQYEARYGADPEDVKTLESFAKAHGLKVKLVNAAARSVVLSGTHEAFSKAFQVQLARYEYQGGAYRGRTGAIQIPTELQGIVASVHGLDDRPQAKPHFRIAGDSTPKASRTAAGRKSSPAAAPAAASTSYTAVQIANAYKFPATGNGKGQTIGIIELGGGFTKADLKTYFSSLAISPAPKVSAVSVDGAKNDPTGDINGPDTEVMLDIEVAGAVAPGAKIVVYFAPNTDAGFLDAINRAVTDRKNKPSVISISWGGAESDWTAQSLQTYNSALQAASVMGVTVCVASGDNGSTDGVSDGLDHVDFPASSPFSLACGGTRLTIKSGKVSSEVVWNEGADNGATGGGVSETFPLPSWQANAKVPTSVNQGNFKGRGVPDVAGDADPASGYKVQVDGSTLVVGGTSAVAPLWAGLIALLNQSLGKPVGFVNPALYQNAASKSKPFRDITSGNNGDYKARKGWDACSGWGSPNGTAVLKVLGS